MILPPFLCMFHPKMATHNLVLDSIAIFARDPVACHKTSGINVARRHLLTVGFPPLPMMHSKPFVVTVLTWGNPRSPFLGSPRFWCAPSRQSLLPNKRSGREISMQQLQIGGRRSPLGGCQFPFWRLKVSWGCAPAWGATRQGGCFWVSTPFGILKRSWIRADFREGDEQSNFSVFRVWRFSEWPEPLH